MATARPRHNRRHNSSLASEQERLTRKREQNRIAQQVYRRAQKERIQALEAAVAKSSSGGGGHWTQSEDLSGTNLLFIDDPAVTASLGSATLAASSSNFTTTLFVDPSLDPDLTQSLGHGSVDGSRHVFGEYARHSRHATTANIAAANITTTSSLSFDQYDKQDYEAESAPVLTFASAQADEISILDASPASDGAPAPASAAEVAENSAAWSHSMDSQMMDAHGGGSSDKASHEQLDTSPTDSTAQHHHAGYKSPSTLRRHHSHRTAALHIAASHGDSVMVKLLLDSGADASLLNKDGLTPLHLAVIAAAEAANRCGGSRNSADCDNDDDGSCSEAKEAEKTLGLLLRARGAGADPRALDNSGRSVLFTAVAMGSEAAVQMVLDAMGSESFAGSSSDSNSGFKGVGSDVSRAGIRAALHEPDAQGTLPLHLAVASRSASMVQLLLSNGADING